jgi:hypothetical protein
VRTHNGGHPALLNLYRTPALSKVALVTATSTTSAVQAALAGRAEMAPMRTEALPFQPTALTMGNLVAP